jgi:heme exporter protein D
MNTLSTFFAMGGYAFYVWSAFGITLGVLTINFLLPFFKHRQLLRQSKLVVSKKSASPEFSHLPEVS